MKYLVYKSEANLNKLDLLALLIEARQNNQNTNITGVLVTHVKGFVQYIEGSESAIDKLFAKIALDNRHNNVTTVSEGSLTEKVYESWDMGYLCLSDRLSLDRLLDDEQEIAVRQFHELVHQLMPMVETGS